jgi:hypothetical protein
MLCTLADAYAQALNTGASLNIGDAWGQVPPAPAPPRARAPSPPSRAPVSRGSQILSCITRQHNIIRHTLKMYMQRRRPFGVAWTLFQTLMVEYINKWIL